ncbi:Os02g0721901, partial [Oryza sativa Japonica Group]
MNNQQHVPGKQNLSKRADSLLLLRVPDILYRDLRHSAAHFPLPSLLQRMRQPRRCMQRLLLQRPYPRLPWLILRNLSVPSVPPLI